ncbi:MAG: hypothetical protein QW560_05140 [Candidatus Nitrosocaldus sp.]
MTVRAEDISPEFSIVERVLLFIADKEPNTIWGDNYYLAGMKLGKYSLVDGKAYGPEYPEGIDENTSIAKIQSARAK